MMEINEKLRTVSERVPELPLTPPTGCPFGVAEEFDHWREASPLMRVSLPDLSEAWLLTRYDDVRAVLIDKAMSSSFHTPGFPVSGLPGRRSELIGLSMIRRDPPDHTRLRRLVTREFMPKNAAALRGTLDAMALRLCDDMAEKGAPGDIAEDIAIPLTSRMINEMLGIPPVDWETFIDAALAAASLTLPDQEIEAALAEVEEYLIEILEVKRMDPQDDILSRLIQARDESDAMTDAELVSFANLLIAAGHDTTANMITLGVGLLVENPDKLQQLRSNPDLWPNAIEELLRLLTVVRTGPRRAVTQPFDVQGRTLQPGDGVVPFILAGNRDAEMFANPHQIDFERENARKHLSFGHGPHQCLGQSLAREELLAILPLIVNSFEGLRMAAPISEVPFKVDQGIFGAYKMPVEWDRYTRQEGS